MEVRFVISVLLSSSGALKYSFLCTILVWIWRSHSFNIYALTTNSCIWISSSYLDFQNHSDLIYSVSALFLFLFNITDFICGDFCFSFYFRFFLVSNICVDYAHTFASLLEIVLENLYFHLNLLYSITAFLFNFRFWFDFVDVLSFPDLGIHSSSFLRFNAYVCVPID